MFKVVENAYVLECTLSWPYKYLVSVILLRVVGRGDHDAPATPEVQHPVRHVWRGANLGEEVHGDAPAEKHSGGQLGEPPAVVAGVVANHHA